MASKKQSPSGTGKGLIAVCAVGGLVVVGIIAAIILLLSAPAPTQGTAGNTESVDHTVIMESVRFVKLNDPSKATAVNGVDMTAISKEINSLKTTDFTETSEVSDYVKISVKDHGDIILRLREDVAPISVKNFRKLVSQKFYDGLTFHRIIQNFMIQGGDPSGDGTGGSPETIKGEFSANGVENDLSHIRGVLSMARKSSPMDSASSQFFICTTSYYAESSLDGRYAAFGYVVAGMNTVDSIAAVPTDAKDRPLKT